MGFFHVVSFENSDEVEIVPDLWLLEGSMCVWPDKKHVPQTWIKNSVPPTSSWLKYSCKIMQTFDCFEKAVTGRKLAEETSDLGQVSGTELGKGRRKKKQICYSSDEDFVESDEGDLEYPTLISSTPKKTERTQLTHTRNEKVAQKNTSSSQQLDMNFHSLPNLSKKANLQSVVNSQPVVALRTSPRKQSLPSTSYQNQTKVICRSPASQPVLSTYESSNEFPSPPRSSRVSIVSGMDTHKSSMNHKHARKSDTQTHKRSIEDLYEKQCSTKRTLKAMKMDLEWIKIEMRKLVSRPQCGVGLPTHEGMQNNISGVQLPKMPLPDIASLDLFENDLNNNRNIYDKLVYDFKVLGGRTPAEATRKMLKYVFSDLLSSQLTWFGTTQKKKLCTLKVVSALQEAVRIIMPEATNSEIEKASKEWLRHSQQRIKLTKQHQNDLNE